MKPAYAASFARHLATFVGGYFAASGVASQEETEQIIGSVLTVVGIAWSMWQKRQLARAAAPSGDPEPAASPKP